MEKTEYLNLRKGDELISRTGKRAVVADVQGKWVRLSTWSTWKRFNKQFSIQWNHVSSPNNPL